MTTVLSLMGWTLAVSLNVNAASGQLPAAVLVGAGDIASCEPDRAEATAKLLDQIAGTGFTAGDNAYNKGSEQQFLRCYERSWGRHRDRTRPSPGNHDYGTEQAAAYFKYFGANAGPAALGYYSYTLGAWHIVSLNSITHARYWGAAQEQWLIKDLEANASECTLAYWHHPLFSSSTAHGNQSHMQVCLKFLTPTEPTWSSPATIMFMSVLRRKMPEGRFDPKGIRQFIAGTGGAGLYEFGPPRLNSEVRNAADHGVLKLTLHPGRYAWEFVPIAGEKFCDSGSSRCSARISRIKTPTP